MQSIHDGHLERGPWCGKNGKRGEDRPLRVEAPKGKEKAKARESLATTCINGKGIGETEATKKKGSVTTILGERAFASMARTVDTSTKGLSGEKGLDLVL